jgi:hypothetical protein
MNAQIMTLGFCKYVKEESRSQFSLSIILAADLMHEVGVTSDVGSMP